MVDNDDLVVGNFVPENLGLIPRTKIGEPKIPINYMQVLHWKHNAIGFQVYRPSKQIPLPVFATKDSAAFDLYCCTYGKKTFQVYSPEEPKGIERSLEHDGGIYLGARDRAMIPTGLHFNIMPGYYVEIWARSGTALKQGIKLANGVGIIDADYKEEVFILVEAGQTLKIPNKSRIAQGQLKKIDPPHIIMEIGFMPERTTDRQGGFGSTDKKDFQQEYSEERVVPRYNMETIVADVLNGQILDNEKEILYNRDK